MWPCTCVREAAIPPALKIIYCALQYLDSRNPVTLLSSLIRGTSQLPCKFLQSHHIVIFTAKTLQTFCEWFIAYFSKGTFVLHSALCDDRLWTSLEGPHCISYHSHACITFSYQLVKTYTILCVGFNWVSAAYELSLNLSLRIRDYNNQMDRLVLSICRGTSWLLLFNTRSSNDLGRLKFQSRDVRIFHVLLEITYMWYLWRYDKFSSHIIWFSYSSKLSLIYAC